MSYSDSLSMLLPITILLSFISKLKSTHRLSGCSQRTNRLSEKGWRQSCSCPAGCTLGSPPLLTSHARLQRSTCKTLPLSQHVLGPEELATQWVQETQPGVSLGFYSICQQPQLSGWSHSESTDPRERTLSDYLRTPIKGNCSKGMGSALTLVSHLKIFCSWGPNH